MFSQPPHTPKKGAQFIYQTLMLHEKNQQKPWKLHLTLQNPSTMVTRLVFEPPYLSLSAGNDFQHNTFVRILLYVLRIQDSTVAFLFFWDGIGTLNSRNGFGFLGPEGKPSSKKKKHRIHGTGIFTYIYHKKSTKWDLNVGKYTSPMDPQGNKKNLRKK